MATYKGPAPGDSPELPPFTIDDATYLTDSTLRFIILEIFPLIIAVFIVCMFLFVTWRALSLLSRSLYIYNIRPFIRKNIKIYRRYRRKQHATLDLDTSSSSSSSDSDYLSFLHGKKLGDLIPKKESRSKSSIFQHFSFLSSEHAQNEHHHHHHHAHHHHHHDHAHNVSSEASRNLIFSPSTMSSPQPRRPLVSRRESDNSQTWIRHHHKYRANEAEKSDVDSVHDFDTSKAKELKKKRYFRVESNHTNKIMHEAFGHLRRNSPGPAQKLLERSPDFRAYDPNKDVWRRSDGKHAQIVIIRRRRKLEKKKGQKKN